MMGYNHKELLFLTAYNVMVTNGNVGDSIHTNEDDDNEADLINHKTILSFRGLAMHEQESTEAAARALIRLQNYKQPEPGTEVCNPS